MSNKVEICCKCDCVIHDTASQLPCECGDAEGNKWTEYICSNCLEEEYNLEPEKSD